MTDEPEFAEMMEQLGTAAIQATNMVKTIAAAAASFKQSCVQMGFTEISAEAMALEFYSMLMTAAMSQAAGR